MGRRTAGELDGEACIRFKKPTDTASIALLDMLGAWKEQAWKLESGEITREEYDRWRYCYPEQGSSVRRAKATSPGLSEKLTVSIEDGE